MENEEKGKKLSDEELEKVAAGAVDKTEKFYCDAWEDDATFNQYFYFKAWGCPRFVRKNGKDVICGCCANLYYLTGNMI